MVSFGGLVRAKSVTRFSWLSVVAEAEIRELTSYSKMRVDLAAQVSVCQDANKSI